MSDGWREVSKDEPCPVCSKPDWCRLADDGAVLCHRSENLDPPEGFEFGSVTPTGRIFRPIRRRSRAAAAQSARAPVASRSAPDRDFERELSGIRARGASLAPWAAQLGVTVESLVALGAVELERGDMDRLRIGFKDHAKPDRALGWPECDGAGRVTTIGARAADGTKGAAASAPRGLVVPADLASFTGPILAPEGFSDTATLHSIGVPAIGRPSNGAGAELLAETLAIRDSIILGENDCKSNGKWAGRDGAKSVASTLAGLLGREVSYSFPPAGSKDARAWLVDWVASGNDFTNGSDRLAAGRAFLDSVAKGSTVIAAKPKRRLVVTGSELTAKSIDWLWFPVLPLGQVALLAGHPDVGKSVVCLDLAARITNGEPFPLAPHPPVAGSVLVVSAEDDLERTVLPRFQAAGGDVTRLRLATEESLEIGNIANILEAMQPDLPADLRLVIVDTLTSLADGIDLNANGDVRGLYRQLRAFAARNGCTVFVIAHFSKQDGRSPLARIAGAVAIGSTPRSAWVALRDPHDETRSLLLKAKMNLAQVEGGFTYHIVDGTVDGAGKHPRIEWGSSFDPRTAAEVLRESEKPPEDSDKARAALDWLDELIPPGGSIRSAEVHDARRSARISERAAGEAARKLQIDTRHRPGGMRGPFFWTRHVSTFPLTQKSDGNEATNIEDRPNEPDSAVPVVPDAFQIPAVPVGNAAAHSEDGNATVPRERAAGDGNGIAFDARRERGERLERDESGDSSTADPRSLHSAESDGNERTSEDDPDAPCTWVEGEPE